MYRNKRVIVSVISIRNTCMPLSLEKARIKPLQDEVVFSNLKALAVGDFVQLSLVMFNGFLSLVN